MSWLQRPQWEPHTPDGVHPRALPHPKLLLHPAAGSCNLKSPLSSSRQRDAICFPASPAERRAGGSGQLLSVSLRLFNEIEMGVSVGLRAVKVQASCCPLSFRLYSLSLRMKKTVSG